MINHEVDDRKDRPDQGDAVDFYRDVLRTMTGADLPFLVGGAYAMSYYTGIGRRTKDLDVFIRREDYERIALRMNEAGYATEMVFPHWLAKAYSDREHFVDLIFSSGNGIAKVDDAWFTHAEPAEVLDVPVGICPIEETIWSKAFIMERERYDGADIVHLLHARIQSMDWHRLRDRFGAHWRVLLSHLTLFGFVYPGCRNQVPLWLIEELAERLKQEARIGGEDEHLCAGTLLSREQYLTDVEEQNYLDARVVPRGSMTAEELAIWTGAIPARSGAEAPGSRSS